MNALIIAPHPDDEVLGCGGTIRRLANEGHRVTVAIVTRGWEPLFAREQVDQVRREALQAAERLGVADLRFMDLPVTRLKDLPAHEINRAFGDLVASAAPEWVFLPFPGDRHEDHRQAYLAASVALRPNASTATALTVACYETPSETHWHGPGAEPRFDPNWHIDISGTLAVKLQALGCYQSQVSGESIPLARRPESVDHLARWRGANMGLAAAEAFAIVRQVWPKTDDADPKV